MEPKFRVASNMHFLDLVDVDEALVDEMWGKVSTSGSYYSIGDGVTKDVFRRMLFESNLVFKGDHFLIRGECHADCVELHPIVFGHSSFRNSKAILGEILPVVEKLFAKKPVCCIIPEGMRGAKHLALTAGLERTGEVTRSLSGVELRCGVYVKRSEA